MKILSFETSCDETGVALLNIEGDLSNLNIKVEQELLATQFETHRPFGGVVPGLARREHEKNLPILTEKINKKDIDLIAVTVGPGLDPCLWVGINFTKELYLNKFPSSKLVGVNHMEGHLYSFLLSDNFDSSKVENIFPAIHLVVSGGHTMIVLMNGIDEWKILGQTRDDAAGEAFDKVARMINLPYPGGPEISSLAKEGDPESIEFPRPMISSDDYDFSFSGLKTSVLYFLKNNFKEINSNDLQFEIKDSDRQNISASFQKAVVDVLVSKTFKAVEEFEARSVMVSGGVAANLLLQETLLKESKKRKKEFFVAPAKYNTDNGVMIGLAGYINYLNGKDYKIESQPNLSL